ncbi:TIGR00730 family Rossman fold protein [Alteraurantiacibacter aquimixticola]|uniref:Cytokinin riboside 5'-monophosphate phosphoribohydrolase n=1 Tax=Alteraurantiacibacter aquimixticola TaxID=2489173 RepID=A0A4T3F1B5_9SPHN|nr:TIGR00730 family Rossman fold protein [Alteraurantiacibacter aquimixticola]TIX49727.1 TIGR00730 family Rossman fold protein [Alteraurantiacibacter aquimixticola]
MTAPFNRIAVYCGSATPADPGYIDLARKVGDALARKGIGVVYGGGKVGLMGAVADGALEAGGEVIGVIPDALEGHELSHKGCTELHVVDTMHERKQMFTDLSDGFVTLPGGVGTMDELWEAVSWAQLGYHSSPVGLLNAFGFYDGLLEFNRKMAEVGFVREPHRGIIIDAETIEDLLDKMATAEPIKTVLQIRSEDL